MNRVLLFERRASTVLFFFLRSLARRGTFLLPANICPIVPAVFILAGHRYEFVDIDLKTLCMDKRLARERLGQGDCAGVFWVHTYGAIDEDIELFFAELKKHNPTIKLIDDRCLARPSQKAMNTEADLELYSTGYSKFVDFGWGGWGFTLDSYDLNTDRMEFDSNAHDRLLTHFRDVFRGTAKYKPHESWLDMREPNVSWPDFWSMVQSAMGVSQRHRALLSSIYRDIIPASYLLPVKYDDWRIHVLLNNPNAAVESIVATGGFASQHYASLVPGFGSGVAPVAKSMASRVVNLFNDFRYDAAMARMTAETVRRFIEKTGSIPEREDA